MNSDNIMQVNQKKYEHLILVFILLIGTILRFWDFPSIPFMHDELSALSRLQFDSLSEVIRKGVMLGDTHPAGIQVFLYFWTAVVGTDETWVKLPFILSGILSIWLTYLIARLWFDGTTALLSSAMIASTQFFIMYSQIARPYISGLLLTLLMVYFWSLFFFKKKKTIYLILYVLFSAMSAYNHHFSLLFAAIVGISGLFFVTRQNLIAYTLAGLVIFILYIPHLNIFFSQLSQGGIGGEGGWLAKPTPAFFFHYINWIFHFSTIVWISVVSVILFLISKTGKVVSAKCSVQKRVLLFVWFIFPLAIGYTYSVLENPVIQYSMLIFTTPYLFILIFSFHKDIRMWQQGLLVIILMAANIFTLVYERDYYNYFYHQPYEETFRVALVDNNAEDVFIIDDCVPYYNEYYFNKFKKQSPYYTKRNKEIDLTGFENIVMNIKENKVVTHALTGEEIQLIQSYFPYQTGYSTGFTYEIYTFERDIPIDSVENERISVANTNFENMTGNWKDVTSMIIYDSVSASTYCNVTPDNEWGPSVEIPLREIIENGFGTLDIEMEIMITDTIENTLITAGIRKDNKTIYWNTINIESFSPEIRVWRKVFMSVSLEGNIKGINDTEDLKLKISIWNKSRINFLINYIKINKKPGNPERYCLYRPCKCY
jgi:uncharacterized membrane protein